MRKYSILLFILFSVPAMPAGARVLKVCSTPTGQGFLERTGQGDLVLHLKGSYYDMGRQHGELMADDAGLAVRAAKFMIWLGRPYLPASLTVRLIYKEVSKKAAPCIPPEFTEEMQGLSDATGVPMETVMALHSITYLPSCSTGAAWGRATSDGALYFARSNDIAAAIDPATGRSYHDHGMIVIYEPQGGIPYVIFLWPGFIGASEGMNARGIAIGNMSLPSRFETPAGIPMSFRIKQALARSESLDEAMQWMTREPLEGGYNFIVADANIPDARVIEMDAKNVYAGPWDGPAESNHYQFQGREYSYSPLPDILVRTNHPQSAELIAGRTRAMDDGKAHSRSSYQRWLDLRGRLAEARGSIGLDSLMELWREHYRSVKWEKGPTLGISSHQVAFAPASGDFLVAFCKGNPFVKGRSQASAFNQPWHRYNLFELMGDDGE